ncbi:MAG: hypothetical protein ABI143_08410 [Caldimonas sp.]
MVTSTKTGIVGKLKNAISGLFGHTRTAADRKGADSVVVAKKMQPRKVTAAKSAAVKTTEGQGEAVKKVARSAKRKSGGAARKSSSKKR